MQIVNAHFSQFSRSYSLFKYIERIKENSQKHDSENKDNVVF